MKGDLIYLKYIGGKDGYSKNFQLLAQNKGRQRWDNRKIGGGGRDVDIGMFSLDACRNDTETILVHFTGLDNF